MSASPPEAPSSGMTSKGKIINVNIGILGHVDSGKTSLVRALSTMLSTAALDKHPQSKERGITLDLGFSAFITPLPEHLNKDGAGLSDKIQYTLVDCPGHASLIRTIIGGAQIIDRMLLVVDVTKGIQTQTAECLVIGEILTNDLVVVLNKIDLIPDEKREAKIEKVSKMLEGALSTTRFKGSPIIPVSAIVGGDGKAGVGGSNVETVVVEGEHQVMGLDKLVDLIKRTTVLPERGDIANQPLYFAVDHCFPIKGQGTVLTGTVLNGSVSTGDTVEIPELLLERKVKSMQMFRKPVVHAEKGDRVALCLTNLNAKLLERGVVASAGSVPRISGAIALIRKVKYFGKKCPSKSKIHVTVGHSTSMCNVTFFGSKELKDIAKTYVGKYLPTDLGFDSSLDYEFDEELRGGGKAQGGPFLQWAFLEFETPVICQMGSMVIGSRLDADVDTKSCRIAFYGRITTQYLKKPSQDELKLLRIYKLKERVGNVERIVDKTVGSDGKVQNVIGKNMFSKETKMDYFINLQVHTEENEVGRIESTFGKTGKFNVFFPKGANVSKGSKLILRHKKYIFDTNEKHKLIQT